MDNKQLAKQMIDCNKTAFDSSCSAMNMIFEQNEKMIESFLSQIPGLPQEGKNVMMDWVSAYRMGCENLQKLVDDNYSKVTAYFDGE